MRTLRPILFADEFGLTLRSTLCVDHFPPISCSKVPISLGKVAGELIAHQCDPLWPDRSDTQCVQKLLKNVGPILEWTNLPKIHADGSAQKANFSIGPLSQ